MQYALLGDIHSSLLDLHAVLDHISREAPDAKLIGTGDLYECTVSKKHLTGQIYPSVEDVIRHPDRLDDLLTFPSIYGNQEERILLLTEQAESLREKLQSLPETLEAGKGVVIHGHQWKPDEKSDWLKNNLPAETLVFHGHTHRSGYMQNGVEKEISFGADILLSGDEQIVNVGAVVGAREWVLYDENKNSIRFMKA
ncbi:MULTISPECIES: metallophosphoesterase family protein [Sporosarcina]|uniref:metallophosphoesterase family protein n=1 Tax=Sporosarcina TaxID=1569 RepID=UPI001891654E|nr:MULTISPECIES: metallophosphoesterase family protein [Sporosarcina]GKV67250.1 hypothetical protein NCCP2331_34030 [Sporosarcina sp. NCCP-2331]GLB57606.1 hypothetical protein NCCP2378_33950 [Sporosarcina sp. NCCP-2378]